MEQKILSVGGKLLVVDNSLVAPKINLQKKEVVPSLETQIIEADSGYIGLKQVTFEGMPVTEQATPSITVSSTGEVTASTTQKAGYVSAGSKSVTEQLPVQVAQTIIPGISDKTIASGRYLIGDQLIKGDTNLIAENIKEGVSIFGVTGNASSSPEGFLQDGMGLLSVSYPAGSTCTITNSADTYIATDTSGYASLIAEAGTWSVIITNGEKTVSKNVEVVSMGHTEVLLEYELTLLPNSNITWTAKKTNSAYVMNAYANRLEFTVGKGSGTMGNNAHFYSTPVDVTGFSKATVHYVIVSPGAGSSPTMRFGFGPDTNGLLTNASYYQFTDTLSDEDTVTADISSLSGMMYFYIGWVKDVSATTFIVDSIILY